MFIATPAIVDSEIHLRGQNAVTGDVAVVDGIRTLG